MYHPRFYGGHYEMGLKYGQLLKKKIAFSLPTLTNLKMEFGLASYQSLANFYPEVVEEIEGFAKGIEDSPENVGAFLLSLGMFEVRGQCSVFAFKNENKVLFGRNYDMLFAYKKFTESSLIAPSGKYAYIAQSDVFIGRSDGMNEKGLAIATSFVNGTTIQPGVSFHFIVRKVLEEASTVQEAIDIIQMAPVSSANNFLVADSNGAMAIIESAVEKSTVCTPTKGVNFLVITNQFMNVNMMAFDKGGHHWSKSNQRFETITEKLKSRKELSLVQGKELLSDECVCLNLRKERFGTIWSVVYDLNAKRIHRSETKPTPNNFKEDERLAWYLSKNNSVRR